MTLWDKGYKVEDAVLKFTVGNDTVLDKNLVKYDCLASIGHAKMLQKTGVLTSQELTKLIQGLNDIIALDKKDDFPIALDQEDCHTAIEAYLTKKLGDLGKKIHTARSRNDQVMGALRLYEKDELKAIITLVKELIVVLKKKSAQHKATPFPGYTHMQKAMPTTVGTLLDAYASSLEDDLTMLEAVSKLIDQNPLGSGAGYGIPVFSVDRKLTAKELGFAKVQENPIAVQLSRGKFEAEIVHHLSMVMYTLNKISSDLILFSMQEFGYFTLPKEFCTGSSIMPQKKNPDVLELVRAYYHVVVGEEMKIKGVIANLISGYNRDMQLTKEPLMKSIDTTKNCLAVMTLVVAGTAVNEKKLKDAMTAELYATEEAYKLVKKGMPFREAYKEVGKKFG